MVTNIKRVCCIPVEVDDVFVDTLKHFVEPSEDFDVVLAEFIVNVLQLLQLTNYKGVRTNPANFNPWLTGLESIFVS